MLISAAVAFIIACSCRIGELQEKLAVKSEAAVELEEQKREHEEKIKQLEASKAQVEMKLAQTQQKVRAIMCFCELPRYMAIE